MNNFYKNKKSDIIFWVDNKDTVGEHLFTFGKVKIYNLFTDYHHNLITEEKEIKIPMFKPVTVFDVSQTDGKPLPQLASELTGNVQNYEVRR